MSMFVNKEGSLISEISSSIFEQDHEEFAVVLFSDDHHTFQEVIIQLMKAIKCSEEDAFILAMEAHVNDYSIVFSGEKVECDIAEKVLKEIMLNVSVMRID